MALYSDADEGHRFFQNVANISPTKAMSSPTVIIFSKTLCENIKTLCPSGICVGRIDTTFDFSPCTLFYPGNFHSTSFHIESFYHPRGRTMKPSVVTVSQWKIKLKNVQATFECVPQMTKVRHSRSLTSKNHRHSAVCKDELSLT
jgi:hypothetical protein